MFRMLCPSSCVTMGEENRARHWGRMTDKTRRGPNASSASRVLQTGIDLRAINLVSPGLKTTRFKCCTKLHCWTPSALSQSLPSLLLSLICGLPARFPVMSSPRPAARPSACPPVAPPPSLELILAWAGTWAP